MAWTWLPLIQCLFDADFPPSSVCHICPPSSCLLTHREGRKWLRSPPSCWMQTAVVHAAALMRSVEHQLRLNLEFAGWGLSGGGEGGGVAYVSARIFVQVCLQHRKRNVYIVSHVRQKHQGERWRRRRRRGRRGCSLRKHILSAPVFKHQTFLIKYLRNVYLRCGTFAPDWKVCKHRSGVSPSHADLFCFYAPNGE